MEEVIHKRIIDSCNYYGSNGSSIMIQKQLVIRVWQREEGETSNLVELHHLPTDRLEEIEVSTIEDITHLLRVMEEMFE
jgi:hypothetical protein